MINFNKLMGFKRMPITTVCLSVSVFEDSCLSTMSTFTDEGLDFSRQLTDLGDLELNEGTEDFVSGKRDVHFENRGRCTACNSFEVPSAPHGNSLASVSAKVIFYFN